AAVRLVATIRSQLSRLILWNGALSAMPALTMRMSIGPLAPRASSNAARTRSGSVTSHWTALPPSPSATAWSGSSRRPSSDSFAPSELRCCATAAPMPVPPPVISAWRPASALPILPSWPNAFQVARRRDELGILETGYPPGNLADEFGNYPQMFEQLLGP